MAALAAAASGNGMDGRWRAASAFLSLATALVILGLTMVPFFAPAWIHFEQDRAGSAALTGYTPAFVHDATDRIVRDLVLGGAFDVPGPASTPVLDPAEVSHMRDVRGVFGGFALVVLGCLAGLAFGAWRLRRAAARTRAAAWGAVRRGAAWLAILLVALGVVAAVAFEPAFELFHQILFPGGNFDFDPRTEKLVQLFPEQFWSETALTYGAVAVAVSVAVAWLASRRRSGAQSAGARLAGARGAAA